jgi:dolichyl-diphosphooligosaccharide--protein glycosyltransferase
VFDNESLAISLILATFYFWIRAVRVRSWPCRVACGLAYTYMAATWGAYIYVLNMIVLHTATLLLLGRYTVDLHLSYFTFFIIGTAGAMQLPIVGWQPLDSMEQISGLLMFLWLQIYGLTLWTASRMDRSMMRWVVIAVVLCVALVAIGAATWHAHVIGRLLPPTPRIRSLFVEHTKTGNPLVDSVAEHQSTSIDAIQMYLLQCGPAAVFGIIWSLFLPKTDEWIFFLLHFCAASYFALKMVRLVLLLAAPVCLAAALPLAVLLEWAHRTLLPGRGDAEKKKKE